MKKIKLTRKTSIYHCSNCSKEVIRYKKTVEGKTHIYCSNECKYEHQKGENNPNFGNKWDDIQRKNFSDYMNKKYEEDPQFRYEVGKSNRGKKFSKERIEKCHAHRDSSSYSHPHSDESKKLIGLRSKEKFTEEYKEKQKKTMVERGHWRCPSEISDYEKYYKLSDWADNMVDFLSNVELEIINLHGFYSHKNTKGMVRDHIFSRKSGYELNVPYYILNHPCNLQIISHSENIKKGFSDRKKSKKELQKDLDMLLLKIQNFNETWILQEKCLQYINGENNV